MRIKLIQSNQSEIVSYFHENLNKRIGVCDGLYELLLAVVVLMSTFQNKNSLRTIEAEISYKIENNEARPSLLVLIRKKRVEEKVNRHVALDFSKIQHMAPHNGWLVCQLQEPID